MALQAIRLSSSQRESQRAGVLLPLSKTDFDALPDNVELFIEEIALPFLKANLCINPLSPTPADQLAVVVRIPPSLWFTAKCRPSRSDRHLRTRA